MIVARNAQELDRALASLRAKGIRAESAVADVTAPDQVRAAVDRAVEIFGRIDILMNNAGVSAGAPAEELALDKWRLVIDTNLTGAFLAAQAVARHMIARGGGCIVNTVSMNALQGGLAMLETNNAAYVASKTGLIGLTRELAAKWARYGIRVNAIAPGYFHTRLTERIWERAEKLGTERIPLGRPGHEGELKGAAVFLASDASSYMTGQTLVIDGGTVLV
jgi:gluconate 5-dehydrogenase